MKIISALSAIGFIILACVAVYQLDMHNARHCMLMAMLWCIYMKLLEMEDKL